MRELRSLFYFFRGERGIRTPGTLIEYDSLANCWIKPLSHLSKKLSLLKKDCKNSNSGDTITES
jgi:hypothetical protein